MDEIQIEAAKLRSLGILLPYWVRDDEPLTVVLESRLVGDSSGTQYVHVYGRSVLGLHRRVLLKELPQARWEEIYAVWKQST